MDLRPQLETRAEEDPQFCSSGWARGWNPAIWTVIGQRPNQNGRCRWRGERVEGRWNVKMLQILSSGFAGRDHSHTGEDVISLDSPAREDKHHAEKEKRRSLYYPAMIHHLVGVWGKSLDRINYACRT